MWKISYLNLIFIVLSQNENVGSTTYKLKKTKYLILNTRICSTNPHSYVAIKKQTKAKPAASFVMENVFLSVLFFLIWLFSWTVLLKTSLRLKWRKITLVISTEVAEFAIVSNHLAQLLNIREFILRLQWFTKVV